MRGRNYAFIDSQNVHLAIRDLGWTLDWTRFRRYLNDKYRVEKAFSFVGYVSGNEGLYKSLHEAGFILIFKPTLEIRKDGQRFVKGNVDAELVLHTMIEWQHYDQAIIASGDGDFYCLIEYLIKQKKLAKLLIPNPQKYSALLRQFRNHIAYMDSQREKLERNVS